jgi:O-antigen/teichoic acid export membrane protein
MPALIGAIVLRAFIGPGEQLLMMSDRQRVVTKIYGGAALLNIALALALAPLFGAVGVSLAVLAASAAATALTARAVRQTHGVWVHAFAAAPTPSSNMDRS